LDRDPGSGSGIRIRNWKNAGSGSVSGSALNQCGSETLPTTKAGVTHSLGGEGVGVNILEDERHRIALLQ